MNKLFRTCVGALAFFTATGASAGNTNADTVTETRPVDARVVRVHLDGIVNLQLRQGATPSLTVTGARKYVTRLTTVQNGDTLRFDSESEHSNGHFDGATVRAELVLPHLREVVSDTFGATEVHGFSGDELVVGLEGAGSMKVDCSYKVVRATLGGVGSMNIAGGSDGIDLDLRGAGYVTLTGKSKWLKADMNGLGGLDAQKFDVDSAKIDLSGLGNATIVAHQSVDLDLSGLGSVTVYGKPLNRKVSVDGLGRVSWK